MVNSVRNASRSKCNRRSIKINDIKLWETCRWYAIRKRCEILKICCEVVLREIELEAGIITWKVRVLSILDEGAWTWAFFSWLETVWSHSSVGASVKKHCLQCCLCALTFWSICLSYGNYYSHYLIVSV